MKRLVTQFDDVRTRATVATPTCCCCCCCCVAATLTASTVTAITAHDAADRARAQRSEPLAPDAANARRPGPPWLYALAGFLALPVALGIGVATALVAAEALGLLVIFAVPVVLAGLVALLYTRAGVRSAGAKTIIPVAIVVFGYPLEVGIAGELLLNGEGTVVPYLAGAVIIAVAVGMVMRRSARA